MNKSDPRGEAIRLDGAPLDYAPQNEQGVVFLFAHLARSRLGLRVHRIQPGFPDCTAYRGSQQIRIEFEYKSSHFARHGHDPRGCDWIVCWAHDWPRHPKHLKIVELRQYFRLGFNVWIVPINSQSWLELDHVKVHPAWSAASEASRGDLVLFYRTRPSSCIQDVFRLSGPVSYQRAGWKSGMDYFAPIRRVARLRAPVFLKELKSHPMLSSAGFVRGSIRGRFLITPHWPELCEMIMQRNPSLAAVMKSFQPGQMYGAASGGDGLTK